MLEWLALARELAGEARVCVYDRAGIGWSDPPAGESFPRRGAVFVIPAAGQLPPSPWIGGTVSPAL